MIIKNLHIGEFGIFRERRMEGIDDGIVLLAGPNRAGKTTFMQILRYLGYKFPKTSIIPPPLHEYKIEADLEDENGKRYVLYRAGYAEPELIDVENGESSDVKSLYTMDDFTYRQLFTISLDELRRHPSGVDNKEAKQLQSVLLGAGLVDMAVIPEIRSNFQKEAEKIGGKHGTPSVKQFKPYYEEIQAALEEKREANHQVDEYYTLQEGRNSAVHEINALEKQIETVTLQRDRLEFLTQQFDNYKRYQTLSSELEQDENKSLLSNFPGEKLQQAERYSEDYDEILTQYESSLQHFKNEAGTEDWKSRYELLMDRKDDLHLWERKLSGFQQRLKDYKSAQERHQEKKEEILRELKAINHQWGNNLNVLDNVAVDEFEIGTLRESVNAYQDTMEEKKDLQSNISELQSEISRKEVKARDLWNRSRLTLVWSVFILAGAMAIAGAVSWQLTENLQWLIIGFGSGLLLSVVNLIPFFLRRDDIRRVRDLEEDIYDSKEMVWEKKDHLEELNEALDNSQQQLNHFRRQLKLNKETPPEVLLDFYRDAKSLKEEVAEWHSTYQTLEQKKTGLLNDLSDMGNHLYGIFEPIPADINRADEMITRLEMLFELLRFARELRVNMDQKDSLEEKIHSLLVGDQGQLSLDDTFSSTEKIRQALDRFMQEGALFRELTEKSDQLETTRTVLSNAVTDKVKAAFQPAVDFSIESWEEIVRVIGGYYEKFVSSNEIQSDLEQVENQLSELESRVRDLRNKSSKLEQQLESLATADRLEKAQMRIDRARSQLEPMARQYATNKIAAHILEKVRDQFLEKTKNELLSKASDIFTRLTSDEFAEISPPDELQTADFLTSTRDGISYQTSDILSRGTREQLFFAVRLSRIYDLPPLPVILDDSFVNFDVQHRIQASKIIAELARRNQVFVLTCHPEIVEFISDQSKNVQYWSIDEGVIDQTTFKHLQKLLSRDA